MIRISLRWPTVLVLMLTLTIAVLAAGCGSSESASGGGETTSGGGDTGAGEESTSSEPIKIGTSLPLTGNYSELGKAVGNGYRAWVESVNERGGILGRQVELKILDDASEQNTVVTDYNSLISRDEVDFVFGTFSTVLNLPASAIAQRHELLYLDPAGAAPEMFAKKNPYYFYTEPAIPENFGREFALYLADLPNGELPKTVAYVATQDPFQSATVGGIKEILTEAGYESVLDVEYPPGETNFDQIALQVKQSGAAVVVNGSAFDDGVGFVRALVKVDATPQVLYQSNAPNFGEAYASAVGPENTEGLIAPSGWAESMETPGNAEFVETYKSMFNESPVTLAAYPYVVGQVLEAALEAVGPSGIEDQSKLADWLHENSVETIGGTISWDEVGAPNGKFAVSQWQGGEYPVILPEELATTDEVLLCWRTCS